MYLYIYTFCDEDLGGNNFFFRLVVIVSSNSSPDNEGS